MASCSLYYVFLDRFFMLLMDGNEQHEQTIVAYFSLLKTIIFGAGNEHENIYFLYYVFWLMLKFSYGKCMIKGKCSPSNPNTLKK